MNSNLSKTILFVFLAFLATAACKLANVSESSNNPAVFSTDNISDADLKDALFSSFKNMANVSSWIADVEMNSDAVPQGNNKLRMKFSKPNNMEMEGTIAGNQIKLISVGGQNYMQIQGKWRKLPASASSEELANSFKEMSDIKNQEAFKNVQVVGTEIVEGKELKVYSYDFDQKLAKSLVGDTEPKSSEIETESAFFPVKVWVDEKSNLPVKINMTIKPKEAAQGTTNIELKYIYDQEVKIEVPTL